MKILCIDDEVDLLENLAEFLEDLGHQVLLAADGVKGLELAKSEQPDLIICDRCMPGMSGTELLETLRREGLLPDDALFFFLTALDDRRDRHATAHLKPTRYLTKPIDFDDLQALIEELTAQNGQAGGGALTERKAS